jgi:hypothetical protein
MADSVTSLEAVWGEREGRLYPRLFGEMRRGIFPIPIETFTEALGQVEVDPRWLHLGVFEYAPGPERGSWLYVTSGGSTPWETEPEEYDENEFSWLGVEFVLEAPDQADWPIRILHKVLAYHLLLCVGRLNGTPLDFGSRLPTGPVNGMPGCALTIVAVARPEHYPGRQALASGKFDFLHLVGISERERDWAKRASTQALIERLSEAGAYPVTNPARGELREA